MPSRALTQDQVMTALPEAPSRISELTAGVPPRQLHAAPDPSGWSANEILAHLRACADVWGDCIGAIAAEDIPTLRAVNPRAWIERTDYPKQDFATSLRAFARQRADLVAVLTALPVAGWSRTATVTGAGKPLVRTVLSYAERLTRHERPHLKQIERVVAATVLPVPQ